MPHPLSLVGVGNMGLAVARSALSPARDGRFVPRHAADPDPAKRQAARDLGFAAADRVSADFTAADVVLLAVKPQHMGAAVDALPPDFAGLLVSVAAGLKTDFFSAKRPSARIVRTMPNTPVLVGRGTVALCPGPRATADDLALTADLFRPAAVHEVPETLMDAVTAVSGSGPAYFFAFVEALAAAGRDAGLPESLADALARETFVGAAALLDITGRTPADLRHAVTSPGGTTQAALKSFEDKDLLSVVRAAVAAALRRGTELSTPPAARPSTAPDLGAGPLPDFRQRP